MSSLAFRSRSSAASIPTNMDQKALQGAATMASIAASMIRWTCAQGSNVRSPSSDVLGGCLDSRFGASRRAPWFGLLGLCLRVAHGFEVLIEF